MQATKPQSETTEDYVKGVERAAASAGSDILYESEHFEGDRQVADLYVTARDRKATGLPVVLCMLALTAACCIAFVAFRRGGAQEVADVAGAYVTTPMSAQSAQMSEDEQERRLAVFYRRAVEKYDAVLIDTSNYRYVRIPGDLRDAGLDQLIRETPFLSKSYSAQVGQIESDLFAALARREQAKSIVKLMKRGEAW